jgi:hypothetical protein
MYRYLENDDLACKCATSDPTEIRTSGLMSGDGKRGGASASVLAPILDSTKWCPLWRRVPVPIVRRGAPSLRTALSSSLDVRRKRAAVSGAHADLRLRRVAGKIRRRCAIQHGHHRRVIITPRKSPDWLGSASLPGLYHPIASPSRLQRDFRRKKQTPFRTMRGNAVAFDGLPRSPPLLLPPRSPRGRGAGAAAPH